MIQNVEYTCAFLIGGIVYSVIELLWRGYTHWSMTIAGGVCFFIIHLVNMRFRNSHIAWRCAAGCAIITAVEFIVGVAVNLVFDMRVWNYSEMYGNIFGQICPFFSCLWFLLSYPACRLSDLLRNFFRLISENDTGNGQVDMAKTDAQAT